MLRASDYACSISNSHMHPSNCKICDRIHPRRSCQCTNAEPLRAVTAAWTVRKNTVCTPPDATVCDADVAPKGGAAPSGFEGRARRPRWRAVATSYKTNHIPKVLICSVWRSSCGNSSICHDMRAPGVGSTTKPYVLRVSIRKRGSQSILI